MSFFGSNKRYSHGVGVSKILEDEGQDWWQKNLANIANGVGGKSLLTGMGLVKQMNNINNLVIAKKFGFLFKGVVNRSYIPEVELGNAVGDPGFIKIVDYYINEQPDSQALAYLFDTYGTPTYGSCGANTPSWLIDGEYRYLKMVTTQYSGDYLTLKPIQITLGLSKCNENTVTKELVIPYGTDKIVMIVYKGTPVEFDVLLEDDKHDLLVDDNGDYLTVGKEVISEFVWFINAEPLITYRYETSPFMVMDYKRKGLLNKSKYIFVMNNRIGVGNKPEPCSSGGKFGGLKDMYAGYPGFGGGTSGTGAPFVWSTNLADEPPPDMFSVDLTNPESSVSCAEHQAAEADRCNSMDDPPEECSDYSDPLKDFGGGGTIIPGIGMSNQDADPSTMNGLIAEEDNKTVLLTYASRYTEDKEHPQYVYREIIDELLDMTGKYNKGFKPARAKGKKAKSNFRGKGLGGYIIYVHDVEIAYVDYFVIANDQNDYGTVDKVLGVVGKDEKVAYQCESRDENTGYSFVVDRIPMRTVDNNSDGKCENHFNDNKVQYMIPYDWMNKRVMTEKFRDQKELTMMIVQATTVRKLKWYETGLFKLVMFVVQLVMSIYMGPMAFLLFTASIIIGMLNISPWIKLALQVAIGMLTGDVSALLTTSNVFQLGMQIANIAFQEYAENFKEEMYEEGKKLSEEEKAAKKAAAKMHRDALYTPLDEINELYEMQYELLYNMYDSATSTEHMNELDKAGLSG